MIEYADDFVPPNLNADFWDVKRIKDGRWEFTEILGSQALKISVCTGDLPQVGSNEVTTERSELSEKVTVMPQIGEEVWYGFSLYIPPDFIITDNRLLFANLKQVDSKRSPVWALRYKNGEVSFLVQSGDERKTFKAPPAQQGRWYRFMINSRIDANHQGYCKAFLDDSEFASFEGLLGHPSDQTKTYFKMGVYRDVVPHTDTLYFAHFRRSLTREFCKM